MLSEEQFEKEINQIIKIALAEDIGDGDHSSLACIPEDAVGEANLLVKEDGIIAGIDFAQRIFHTVDADIEFTALLKDGDRVKKGDLAFRVKGRSQSILKTERVMLNAMQRMSAIATKTNSFVEVLKPFQTQILDTRKTTPGLRVLEKWAVRIGGGANHRYALYDMIMLKDNHIDFAGGITKAIAKTKAYLKERNLDLKIIVEARDLNEIEEILKSHKDVYRILIDNFNYTDTKKAVDIIDKRCLTESSGNITLKTASKYAECGVDFISSGALTHSVYNLDLSLKAVL
ncbi:carboxylating nicotinate-nucleotide diphosphorylase [Psychroflexus halocasei]|uniref:Probable nicotinate-nucleotide pyrophosphorylase [carboxylating] n=1 Tax=Psychroflexus halocasei TaxID=908615 RepID=A0A1H3YUN0_9FLAO|nr:carboxylating nicotinate-nucleotide diphosphorylase [Psychroflexus halocasei]SEA14752.1 nicotinate-nucleotide pyrophosphorylase (carboxylating) [Psychroflexus halocasei]